MKLSEAEILKLLPAFMRQDSAVQGLAAGTDSVTRQLAARIRLLTRWDKIEEMDEDTLDQLAWELNIFWYDSTADIDIKRALVKNSDLVHSRLGTRWAVEQVIKDYFGDALMEEWFEYGGDPHYFRITVTNTKGFNVNLSRFLEILSLVKRTSSWLENLLVEIAPDEAKIYLAATITTGERIETPYHPDPGRESHGYLYCAASIAIEETITTPYHLDTESKAQASLYSSAATSTGEIIAVQV